MTCQTKEVQKCETCYQNHYLDFATSLCKKCKKECVNGCENQFTCNKEMNCSN